VGDANIKKLQGLDTPPLRRRGNHAGSRHRGR
jgi:hypothetical protein